MPFDFKGETLGKRLELLRTKQGWSQKEAAEKCGTCPKNYWNWENNKNRPSKNSKRAIVIAFGVSENIIFGGVI